ncbi:MAG: terminase large subunit, partial [Clostridiales bacterium]|nr:terminase large subunit [Clostridiales bacterium]
MNYILDYWNEIESGRINVSKRIKAQYAKLVDNIREPKGSYIFDEKRAEIPIAFIEEFCKHSKGEWAGRPVILELFQKAFISALFGFIDKNTFLRQYREAMFYVARKNGKSTMLAGIALY